MDLATFRAIFPEFGDAGRYPDARVNFYLMEAGLRLTEAVWGELRDSGIANYVAHSLSLSAPAPPAGQSSGSNGAADQIMGMGTGLLASASVGPISVSFDTASGQSDGGGAFNLTRYGQTFLSLASSVSVGARQF